MPARVDARIKAVTMARCFSGVGHQRRQSNWWCLCFRRPRSFFGFFFFNSSEAWREFL